MDITLALDDQVAQDAQELAKKMGKTLDEVVLDYLEQLAGSAQPDQQWAQFEQRCLTSGAKRNGWNFNRDETYFAWLIEAEEGLADVAAGRSSDARASIAAIQARGSASRIRNALRTVSITPKRHHL